MKLSLYAYLEDHPRAPREIPLDRVIGGIKLTTAEVAQRIAKSEEWLSIVREAVTSAVVGQGDPPPSATKPTSLPLWTSAGRQSSICANS